MTWKRVLGTWALLAVVMSANGVLRETALARVLPRWLADVASAALGIAMILGVTRMLLAPARGVRGRGAATVAATWLMLTLAFEFLFGHFVDRKSWSELFANYALWRGRLWPVVLASVVAAPFLWLGGGGPRTERAAGKQA